MFSLLRIVAVLISCLGLASWTPAPTAGNGGDNAQLAYLKPPNTGGLDLFGTAVAVSGDTVFVGAPQESGSGPGVNGPFNNDTLQSGAAYTFVRSGTSWSQDAYFKSSNADEGDGFGSAVTIDGDTLAVGAPFEDSNATGVDGDAGDNSMGQSGAVFVFARTGTTWTQEAYVKASNTGGSDFFGTALDLDGDTLVVSAPAEDSASAGVNGDSTDDSMPEAGAVYVFVRSGTTWSQQAYLKGDSPGAFESFGSSVAIDGDTLVVGAMDEDIGGENTGAAFVFVRTGTTWAQQACLKASNPDADDSFGFAVALSGDTVAIGAPGEDGGQNGNQGNGPIDSGAAYVFQRSGSQWSQEAYLKATNVEPFDTFGHSLALAGDLLTVSAPQEDGGGTGLNGNPNGNANPSAGAVYVYRRVGPAWVSTKYVKASNSDSDDRFGTQVAASGELVICGAPGEDSNSTEIDKPMPPDSGFDCGAVYAFEFFTPYSYCVAKPNSNGCTATIEICGSPSLAGFDPLIVDTVLVPPVVNGLLFYGRSGSAQIPFMGGTLCVRPPLKRTTIQNSGGLSFLPCDGRLAFDFTSWVLGGNDPLATVGTPVFAQYWFRDAGDPLGVGLTNATQFTLVP